MTYAPSYGQMTGGLKTPFGSARYDGLSFRLTPIELLSLQQPPTVLSYATGFFWTRGNRSFLVTNHHVLTGLNVFTQQNASASGLRAETIRYFRPRWLLNGDGSEGTIIREPQDLALWRDGRSAFLEHPRFADLRVDIAVAEVPALPRYASSFHEPHVNDYAFERLFHFVGYDAFVVGYPYRSYVEGMPAMWKRGSYATEPLVPFDGRPMMLLDVASTAGMSGSPVFRRTFGPAAQSDMSVKLDAVVSTEFIGVYAGRIISAKEGDRVSMGYCWYGGLIDEIIDHGLPISQAELERPSIG